MIYRNLLVLVVMAIVLCAGSPLPSPPKADHHIHIRSERGTDALIKILEKVKNQSEVKVRPSVGAEEVIAMLDSAGTQKAALLSTAYFFGMPEVDFANERTKVRRENEYVARQAERYPQRLAAFCGVNPLAEYAINEIKWCGKDGRFDGLKLHFANSAVDLRKEEHLKRMARVFDVANEHNLAIVVHLWTRNPDYGKKDINIFIDKILPEAPDVTVQVAHFGGPGNFSPVTNEVSKAFVDALEKGVSNAGNLYFDLAAVPQNPAHASTRKERESIRRASQQLAKRIKQIGAEHILWGTDWIAGPLPVYLGKLKSMPLNNQLWGKVDSNVAPYLQ